MFRTVLVWPACVTECASCVSHLVTQGKGLGARVRKGARMLCPFMFGMGVDDDDETATNATCCPQPLPAACLLRHCLILLSELGCRSDTQSNYSQVSAASSNWEDTDYDERGDRASNATEAHQRQQWQQQQPQQQQQQQQQQQAQDTGRVPKKVSYAQQLVQSVFPQVPPAFNARRSDSR